MPLRSVPFARIARIADEAHTIGGLSVDDLALRADTLTQVELERGLADRATLAQVDQRVADRATLAQVDARIAAAHIGFDTLTAVPAGFADGVDNDTLYTAAATGGLLLTGTAFSLAGGGVTSTHVKDGSIAATDLATGAVTNVKIADNAVGATKMQPNAITTSALVNGAVDGSKWRWPLLTAST